MLIELVSNPKFADMMQQKINMLVDTTELDQEIGNYEKQLRQSYSTKSKLMEEIDFLLPTTSIIPEKNLIWMTVFTKCMIK